MWSRQQIIKLQIYRRGAHLADQEYRALLRDAAGITSSTHPAATQFGYDQVMARIEAILDYRVQEAIVPAPDSKVIANLHHWRRRLPQHGEASFRAIHKVRTLWAQLQPALPDHERTDAYLHGIASKACACRVQDIWQLQAWQAGLVIDALRDRLHYAMRRGQTACAT